MIRILVADPELSVRLALQDLFAGQSDCAVVAEARSGEEVLQHVSRQPDVVLLSTACLEQDGEPLTSLRTRHFLPVVLMGDTCDHGSFEFFRSHGARQLVPRPRPVRGGAQLEDVDANAILAAVRIYTRLKSEEEEPETGKRRILAIGASTGGPQAVMRVLGDLPPGLGMSVLIVQHMASGLVPGYAEWLDRDSPMSVRMARGGERLVPGTALVAPGGNHLCLSNGALRLRGSPPVNSCRPSVDVLFESLAEECASAVVAVLLTGIGKDGAKGMAALKEKGAHTIAQDEASSVVYGMPRAALELSAVHEVLPLEKIAAAVASQFDIAS